MDAYFNLSGNIPVERVLLHIEFQGELIKKEHSLNKFMGTTT